MRRLLSAAAFDRDGLAALLDAAARWKALRARADAPRPLAGRCVGLWFDLPSTRTRVSMEAAVAELGAHPVILRPEALQLARGETVADTVRALEGYLHALAVRTREASRLDAIARAASIPVINALTPRDHPLQALADLAAIREHRGRLEGARVAFLGDGASNVARSLALAAPAAGILLAVASPAPYRPDEEVLRRAGPSVRVTGDPFDAVREAEFLYTDVWVSMGREDEAGARRRALAPFRLDRRLLEAAPPQAVAMHCLPAHPGEEIEREILDGPRSLVWEQARWRLHTAKAVLEAVLSGPAACRGS